MEMASSYCTGLRKSRKAARIAIIPPVAKRMVLYFPKKLFDCSRLPVYFFCVTSKIKVDSDVRSPLASTTEPRARAISRQDGKRAALSLAMAVRMIAFRVASSRSLERGTGSGTGALMMSWRILVG